MIIPKLVKTSKKMVIAAIPCPRALQQGSGRAFSPYHQGPIIGPIPNPNYSSFFPNFPKKSPSEAKKKSHQGTSSIEK